MQTPPTSSRFGCRSVLIFMAQLAVMALALGVLVVIGGYVLLSYQLSDGINQVATFQSQAGGTPRFFDRHGTLLYEMPTVERRQALTYDEISPHVVAATVAAEDDSFWSNPGVDPAAIGAALIGNARNEGARPVGASTITQQLVRHVVFDYEERSAVSYSRKLREIFLALIMTQQRGKQDIMTMYLNEIYYGNLAYGIEAAAQTYFAKSAADLSLAEAAFLAGLPQAPLDRNPYVYFDAAKAQQERILDELAYDGVLTEEEVSAEKETPISLALLLLPNEIAANTPIRAPHFVLYVVSELERRFGPEAMAQGGWQITTSLDLTLQDSAEASLDAFIAANEANHNVHNGAVVALKPATGEILTMVGSRDYFDEAISGQINMAIQPRQPGSTFKPITYAAALERGWTPADVLWDVPIELDLGGGRTFIPQNYDGGFHGPLLLRDALANSYNIPPIQLARDVGLGNVIQTARNLGVTSLTQSPETYGLTLTLGAGEVPLVEMSQVYATLANQGRRASLTSILRITDSRGNPVYDRLDERLPAVNAISPEIAFILSDMLDDDEARRPGLGYTNALELPFPAAAKTGTTNDFRDSLTIGTTPGLTVGVWLGNADGALMDDLPGSRGAATVWREIMLAANDNPLLQQELFVEGGPPPTEFVQPSSVQPVEVCLPVGTGGARCSAWREEFMLPNSAVHGIARIGYAPDTTTNPGAWTLRTEPFSGSTSTQPPLDDGSRPPNPTECVVNRSRADSAEVRLYLPIPPYYPDEVRARNWARGTGYRMAPPLVCPP